MASSPRLFLGVTGQPLLRSRSVSLFKGLFQELGLAAHYTRLCARSAPEALAMAAELGLHGLNVTSPLKESLARALGDLDASARGVGAVNSVLPAAPERVLGAPAAMLGRNTDPFGVSMTLRSHGLPRGRPQVVILGAGGAARAAVSALIGLGLRDITIVNRTFERARTLAATWELKAAPLSSLPATLRHADLLISCVSGDPGLVSHVWLRPGLLVLDADYQALSLVEAARRAGARLLPGTDWLAFQAAASFQAFTGLSLGRDTVGRMRLRATEKVPRPIGIALLGFPGAGKSSVGRILSARLGWDFVDLDERVAQEAGAELPTIFAREGEAGFRRRERAALAGLQGPRHLVLALGGGTPVDPASRDLLPKEFLQVLLHAPLAELLPRLSGSSRPLLRSGDPAELYAARREPYLECAELVLSSARRAAHEVADHLLAELDSLGEATSP